jgi:hypothetical protein
MSRHANLPFHIYVNVDNKFLGEKMPSGTTPAIWHSVFCRSNQVLMCHVLLESGANWTGLPIQAISTKESFEFTSDDLMPWAAMGEDLDIFNVNYLEGIECETREPIKSKGRHTGIMIDWKDGFSRYPQEHKPLNMIELENGQFAFLPNNFVVYNDKHFVSKNAQENLKYYKRGEKIYWGK